MCLNPKRGRYLFGMEPLLVAGDLSLSGTLLAWSGIGHAATPNTLGCMASPGLDCVGDRPISTRCSRSHFIPNAPVCGARGQSPASAGLVVSARKPTFDRQRQ